MTLIIDNRESIKHLFDTSYPIVFKNLDIGDYVIQFQGEPLVIIERKTVEDYAASIKDGRGREQKARLLGNFPKRKILYIIEGDMSRNNKSFTYNAVSKKTIVSSVLNCIFRDNISIFHTKNSDESVFFIQTLYAKLAKNNACFRQTKTYDDSLISTICIKKNKNITPAICQNMMLNLFGEIKYNMFKGIIEN